MAASPARIAFVTMVRDDHFFLRIWVEYYARHVPRHHLFILMDGFDQTPPDFAAGCQIITLPRSEPGPGWDMKRWTMLADFNAMLLGRFDVVVLNDVDEIIVPDPAYGIPLLDAVARAREVGVISPFAVEVVHRHDLCPDRIDPDRPILRQRPHVRVNSSYAKPCISSARLKWSLGGHRSDFPQLNLDNCLFLFHLRYLDRDMLLSRQQTRLAIANARNADEAEVAGIGWTKSTEDIERFLISLQASPPHEKNFQFDWQRRRMTREWRKDAKGDLWRHGKVVTSQTYIIPERFLDAF
ncbi:MAG: hypothetical protein ACK4P8_06105 [Tabrizicola sp.]